MSVNPFAKDGVKVINGQGSDINRVDRKCKRTDKEPGHCYNLVLCLFIQFNNSKKGMCLCIICLFNYYENKNEKQKSENFKQRSENAMQNLLSYLFDFPLKQKIKQTSFFNIWFIQKNK